MTAEPQYIIMGMSLENFFGGWEGNKEFKAELTERTGLTIATGTEAARRRWIVSKQRRSA